MKILKNILLRLKYISNVQENLNDAENTVQSVVEENIKRNLVRCNETQANSKGQKMINVAQMDKDQQMRSKVRKTRIRINN